MGTIGARPDENKSKKSNNGTARMNQNFVETINPAHQVCYAKTLNTLHQMWSLRANVMYIEFVQNNLHGDPLTSNVKITFGAKVHN